MKRIALFFILVLTTGITIAQQSNWTGSISFGLSVPINDFQSTSLSSDKAGMARDGFFFKVNADYSPKTIGLSTALLFNSNALSKGAMGLRLEERINTNYRELTDEESEALSFNSDQWLWGALLAGPMVSIPAGKTHFLFKAMSGFQITFFPVPDMFFDDEANNILFHSTIEEKTAISLPMLLGASINYQIKENIALGFNVDYYYSQTSYTFQDLSFNTATNTLTEIDSDKHNVSLNSWLVGFGLVYTL